MLARGERECFIYYASGKYASANRGKLIEFDGDEKKTDGGNQTVTRMIFRSRWVSETIDLPIFGEECLELFIIFVQIEDRAKSSQFPISKSEHSISGLLSVSY